MYKHILLNADKRKSKKEAIEYAQFLERKLKTRYEEEFTAIWKRQF